MIGLEELHLASASPRRRAMLAEAGYPVRIDAPPIDDGLLRPGPVPPRVLVVAMAYFKARQVVPARPTDAGLVVLGADTLCVHGEHVLGKPTDADAARRTLELLRDATHETMTGVCLLHPASGRRLLFVDVARVNVGHVDEEAIDAYVASGAWRGKAGGYNLADRVEAGWPISCEGDPSTVMGLPMRRLAAALACVVGPARRSGTP